MNTAQKVTSGQHVSADGPVSDIRAWVVLWKAFKAVEQSALHSVSALKLGLSDFAVLEVLLHKGPQPVNVIGRKVFLTSGSITSAVDRLESRKLVRRTNDSHDRRSRVVQLTPRGKTLIARAFRQHAGDIEVIFAVLKQRERAQLIHLLKKLGMSAANRPGKLSGIPAVGSRAVRHAKLAKTISARN